LAPDPDEESYRPLLILRSDILRLWSVSGREQEGLPVDRQHARQAQSETKPRPASEALIRKTLKDIYSDPKFDRPNVVKAYQIVKKRLPNAGKAAVMKILKEPAFAGQRRSPGNQSD
jgi:hypothetical protein